MSNMDGSLKFMSEWDERPEKKKSFIALMMLFVTPRQLSQLFMNFKKTWINPGKVNFP